MSDSKLTDVDRSKLLAAAQEVLGKAYAPYSRFRLGAAVLTESGNLYQGCNVENASYGLTICAERSAIFAAVAQEGGERMKIRALAVVCEQVRPFPPCGACRQVISEFGREATIIFRGDDGIEEMAASDLLPKQFCLL